MYYLLLALHVIVKWAILFVMVSSSLSYLSGFQIKSESLAAAAAMWNNLLSCFQNISCSKKNKFHQEGRSRQHCQLEKQAVPTYVSQNKEGIVLKQVKCLLY